MNISNKSFVPIKRNRLIPHTSLNDAFSSRNNLTEMLLSIGSINTTNPYVNKAHVELLTKSPIDIPNKEVTDKIVTIMYNITDDLPNPDPSLIRMLYLLKKLQTAGLIKFVDPTISFGSRLRKRARNTFESSDLTFDLSALHLGK